VWCAGLVTTTHTTADRLLDVAERLLLESGYERLSVRAVNTAAGMNPAAVHYHFGSKEALVTALLEDRLGPLWEAPLADLASRRPVSVAELVEVVIGPLTGLAADPVGRLRLHLLARFVLGRRGQAFSSRWFTLRPWVEMLRAARPDLSEQEARHRWMLAFTVVLQAFGDPLADTPAEEHVPSATLTAFVVAGLDAP
jgi:AcrR family transcriptional regulator